MAPSDTPCAQPSSAPENARRAQAVRCGPWLLAFPFEWARSIVEQYELSEVPHAPPWLMGAANVGGQIVPVFDLAAYAQAAAGAPGHGAWLLLGGEGEDRFAILSTGRPLAVRVVEPAPGGVAAALPPALAEFARGVCMDDEGQVWSLLDPQALGDALAADLSLA